MNQLKIKSKMSNCHGLSFLILNCNFATKYQMTLYLLQGYLQNLGFIIFLWFYLIVSLFATKFSGIKKNNHIENCIIFFVDKTYSIPFDRMIRQNLTYVIWNSYFPQNFIYFMKGFVNFLKTKLLTFAILIKKNIFRKQQCCVFDNFYRPNRKQKSF